MKPTKPIATGLFLLFWGTASLHAQSGVVAAGGDASGSGGSVSYSIGQVDYVSGTGTGSITAGVQQPYEILVVSLRENVRQLDCQLFPSLVSDKIELTVPGYQDEAFTYSLYDMSGRLILQEKVQQEKTFIQMNELPAATYLLTIVTETNQKTKQFKIVKN